jgi:predicted RNase H-like HicB family nuclease
MLSMYPACFFKEDNGYSVIFPDLKHLSTCGQTLDEAMFMAVDCLAGYLFFCKMDGDIIPAPSSLKDVSPDLISEDLEISPFESFVNMVSVDVEAYSKQHFEKSVNKNLTIPTWLNKAALEKNINFSQVLQEALIAKVRTK